MQSFQRKYFLIIVSILTAGLILLPPSEISGLLVCLILISLTILPVYLSYIQKDTLFVIVYVFCGMYSLPPIFHYLLGVDINHYRTQCQTPSTIYQTTLTMIVFYIGLISGQWQISKVKPQKSMVGKLRFNSNNAGYMFCVLLAIFCIVYGKSGDTIVESGGYGKSDNVQMSTLYGYGIIPILIGLTFSISKIKLRFIFFISAVYVIKDLLYGGRIDSIQLCLGLYILYFRYKWSLKKTIAIAILAFSVMIMWGIFRSATERGLMYAYHNLLDSAGENGNASDVFYSSMCLFYLMDNGILDLGLRLQALVNFILSIILPYSWLPDIANLSLWLQQYVSAGGGGLISSFVYVGTGWIGVLAVSYLIGKGFRKFQRAKGSPFFIFWIILVIATVPRWYAYYPIALVKLDVVGAIMFVLLNKFLRSPTKKKIVNSISKKD